MPILSSIRLLTTPDHSEDPAADQLLLLRSSCGHSGADSQEQRAILEAVSECAGILARNHLPRILSQLQVGCFPGNCTGENNPG